MSASYQAGEVAVVADAHLGGPGGPAAPLVAELAALPASGCRYLLLLGDIFQIWIGDRRYETPDIVRVVDTLRALRQAGVRIDYVEGNRDFFLADSPYADAFDRVTDEVAFTAGATRYLAVHGDGLDVRDRRYRFWRRASKGPLGRLAVAVTPGRFARRLAFGTEERLAETNRQHKREIPEAVLRLYGERRLAEGHDVLLLGHFHEARSWRVPGGEVRLLPAWYERRELVRL